MQQLKDEVSQKLTTQAGQPYDKKIVRMGEFNEDEANISDEDIEQIYHKKENLALMLEDDFQSRKEKASEI